MENNQKWERLDQVSFIKLKDGGWGLRGGKNLLREGEEVTVTLKNGSTKKETVDKIVWWDDYVAIATIKQIKNPHLAQSPPNTKIQD